MWCTTHLVVVLDIPLSLKENKPDKKMSLKNALNAAKKKYGMVAALSPDASASLPTPADAPSPLPPPTKEAADQPEAVGVAVEERITDAPPAKEDGVLKEPLLGKTAAEVTDKMQLPAKVWNQSPAREVLLRPKRPRDDERPRPKMGKEDVVAFMAKVKATQPKI